MLPAPQWGRGLRCAHRAGAESASAPLRLASAGCWPTNCIIHIARERHPEIFAEFHRGLTPGGILMLAWAFVVERVTGIEPALSAWEADVLPLNYTREQR
jgi:hypothetical protein